MSFINTTTTTTSSISSSLHRPVMKIDSTFYDLKMFQSLPSAVYFLVQSFIPKDYKNFINSCKTIVNDIKYETVYYNLNQISSFNYCSDEYFRNRILSKIRSKRFQVSINLAQFRRFCAFGRTNASLADNSLYANVQHVHKLKIEGRNDLTDLSLFRNIEELLLINFPVITNTTGLSNISKLSLKGFPLLQDISNLSFLTACSLTGCPMISDISVLADMKYLHLEDCPKIGNISSLGNQIKLSIINCGPIASISNLSKIKYLHLEGLSLIESISCLFENCISLTIINLSTLQNIEAQHIPNQKNQFLYVERCTNLLFISNLPQTSTLRCKELTSLTTLSDLPNLYTLEIMNCSRLMYFPDFPRIETLSFTSFTFQENHFRTNHSTTRIVFPNLRSLSIDRCNNFHFLQGKHLFPLLESLRCDSSYNRGIHLSLENSLQLKKLKFISGNIDQIDLNSFCKLQNLEELSIINYQYGLIDNYSLRRSQSTDGLHRFFSRITSSSSIPHHLKSITIERLPYFNHTQYFSFVQSITLSYLDDLLSLEGLKEVPRVEISYCSKLEDLSGLGNNHFVRLVKCESIRNISPLRTVKEVYISYCKNIQDVDSLRVVGNLMKYLKL